MPDIKDSVIISKPLEEVFSYAANMDNSSKIMQNVVAIEKLTEGPVQVGTKFKETREIRGRQASSIIEFIEFLPNERYVVQSEANGLKVIYHYDFKPTVDGGTKVHFQGDIHTSGIVMKLTKPIIRKILKKEDGDHLSQLKKLLEGTAEEEETETEE